MSPVLSVYLDLVRFLASLAVVADHVWPLIEPLHPLPWPGHEAVVVFFVLSGLVIAHTASRPNRSFAIYVQHRLARIWSVAIPALLLCLAVACLVSPRTHIYAAAPITNPADSVLSAFINLFFLGQVWSLDVSPPLNAPYWSVNFEVWYYIIFGLWTYVQSPRRIPAVLIACLIAGPKILLLMPIWLLGVTIQRLRLRLTEGQAIVVFVATLIVGAMFFWFNISISIRTAMTAMWPGFTNLLQGSNQFIGDSMLGIIVAANLFAVSRMQRAMAPILAWKRQINGCASFTFSAYLYHMPLFALLWDVARIRSPFLVVPALALGIMVLGQLTERQLPRWRDALERIVTWRSRRPPPASALQ